MKDLLSSIEVLKNSEIHNLIKSRIREFSEIKFKSESDIFKELCFCIMTANCGAEKCIEIFDAIGDDFLNLTQIQLTEKFKALGYRFPNVRSTYIVEAREYKNELVEIIKSEKYAINKNNDVREWIVENIKGIGYKEGSHFLRNIGYVNYAIIDFHIIDLLAKHNLIKKPKTMTKQKYLEIEGLLREIGDELNLNLAELDLYLWFLETGKVLK